MNHRTLPRLKHLATGLALASSALRAGCASPVPADYASQTPVLGQARGNALNWRYTLRIPVDGRSWEIEFDDWMFLVDPQLMINRAVMRKFGIRVGEVLLSFQRLPA